MEEQDASQQDSRDVCRARGKRSEECVCSGKGAAPRDMSAESSSCCSVKHRYGNCECQVSAFGKEFPLAEQFSVPPA